MVMNAPKREKSTTEAYSSAKPNAPPPAMRGEFSVRPILWEGASSIK